MTLQETAKINCNIVLSNDSGELPDDKEMEVVLLMALAEGLQDSGVDPLSVEVVFRTGELD